jgi:Flp pilus assembly protein CpaB
MNRVTQLVIGLLAITLAIGAGIYGRNVYLKEVSTYQVPVPVSALPAYTVLSADMFQMRDMPRTMESLPYYQSIDPLVGKISAVPLPSGLPVPQVSVIPVTEFRLADATYEVLSIPVDPVSAVGGQVRIGERINLYQVIPAPTDPQAADPTKDPGSFQINPIAEKVQVVDVRSAQGAAAETGQQETKSSAFGSGQQVEQVQILTLAVEPGQVKTILDAVAMAKKQGGLLWTSLAIP